MIRLNSPISKESFLFACEIFENDNPSVTHRAANHFADQMTNLVANDAFVTGSLNYCLNQSGETEDLYFENNQPGYFDQDNQFIAVSFENFTKYDLRLDWMVKTLSNVLGLGGNHEEILPDLLWQIGLANLDWEVPIFLARKIKEEEIFDKINKVLNQRKSSLAGLILSSCSNIPSYFSLKIASHKIIPLQNCLSVNKSNFSIDKNILKSVLLKTKKDGFTTGYRSACFNGEYFRFTKQEADILEFLYNAGKPVHKDEIMAEITESSTELKTLFRSPDSRNIRQNILQHDKKGYYWLNLN